MLVPTYTGCRCFFHFSASLFSFFLISVPFRIFPVRDFISHFPVRDFISRFTSRRWRFFLHSRRWRPPVIARRGKCRVSSLGVLGRVGERGHPGGRRQREQRRAGVHARSLRPPGGFHERYDGAKGTGNDGEGWSCASRAATATRRDVDGRRRLTYLDVAWRAAGRMSPSSSSPVVLVVRRRRRRRPRRRHRRRPCRPRFRNLHRQQQQQPPQQQQQRVESHHQFTFRGGWEGAGWEERRTPLE